jgi:hypothetical protein
MQAPFGPFTDTSQNGITAIDVGLSHPDGTTAAENDPVVPGDLADETDHGQGVHYILKKTDYWFNLELAQLERHVREEADRHTRAGLPRADVPALEEMTAEIVIRERATRLFLEWSERVKRKIQDAIQESSVAAGTSLLQLRHSFDRLQRTMRSIETTGETLAQRREQAGKDRFFQYGRLLKRWTYIAVISFLILVDWIANVPVFQQLLPQEPGAEQAWLELMDKTNRYGWFAGLVRVGARLSYKPEVSLLALGVVVFLMLLGHFFGSSLRRVVAFRAKEEATTVLGLKSHRRQAWWPLSGAALGIVLVICFLFLSRGKLSAITAGHLDSAQQQVALLQGKIQMATQTTDLDKLQNLHQKLSDAEDVVDTRAAAADYAKGVSNINWAILLLNLTLVIVAIVAAYLENASAISEAKLADPAINALDAKIVSAHADAIGARDSIQRLAANIQANISRARYLAESMPLRDWEAKARRLEAMIPLFRTENARLRGIDVQNIISFRQPCRKLELPIPIDAHFELPAHIEVCERDFSDLYTQMTTSGVLQ